MGHQPVRLSPLFCLVFTKTRACGGNTHDDTYTRNTAYVTKGIGENGGTV
jgi:hypothetical protein